MSRKRKFVILDSDDEGDWLVDKDDGLGMDHPLVAAYMRSLRERRTDIRESFISYLCGETEHRVQNLVDAKIDACLGSMWDQGFLKQLRKSSKMEVLPMGHEFEGQCDICGLQRWVSCKLTLSRTSYSVGRVCAARALMANTLLHVQRNSPFSPSPMDQVEEAFVSLLGMVSSVCRYTEGDGLLAANAMRRMTTLRETLGF